MKTISKEYVSPLVSEIMTVLSHEAEVHVVSEVSKIQENDSFFYIQTLGSVHLLILKRWTSGRYI